MRTAFALTIVLACAVLLLAMQQAAPAGQPVQDLTAAQILDRVSKVYAECKTYSDRASVGLGDRQNPARLSSLKTAFRRPGELRLEMTTYSNAARSARVVWCHDRDVKTWLNSSGTADAVALSQALQDPSEDVGLAARLVPSLLLPDQLGGSLLAQLTDVQRVRDANACLRVDGRLQERKLSLWIEPASFTLLRVDVPWSGGEAGQEQQLAYAPVIDGVVADAELVFDPKPPPGWFAERGGR